MDGQHALITDNLGLAHKMANKYIHRVRDNALDYDDLYAEGCLALIEAAKRFDPSKGKFSTYACTCISGYILRYIRRKGFVSVPQYIIDTASIIMRQSLQDHPIEEISAITGLRTNHIEWALEYLKVRAISMDKATSEDEDTNFDNYVPYHEDYSTAYVKDFIQSLKPKHREVLLLVLQHKSLREIGETFGISYQGVGNRMVFVRKYMMQYQAAANGQA